jgi:cytochrome c
MIGRIASLLVGLPSLGGLSILVAGASSAQTGRTPPPPTFAQCAICHAVTADAPKKIGPTLAGVAGKPAATRPGIAYSPALKAAKINWTDDKLDQYLAQPAKTVPGTKMAFAGVSDAKKRADLVAYLKTLR